MLGTTCDDTDGSLVPVQLTVDFKPNLPGWLSSTSVLVGGCCVVLVSFSY